MGDPEAQADTVQTFRELLDPGFKGQHLDPLPQPPARPQPDERLPNVEEVCARPEKLRHGQSCLHHQERTWTRSHRPLHAGSLTSACQR